MTILGTFMNMIFQAEAQSEFCQTSKMEIFVQIVNDFQPLTIFAKSAISDA